MKLYDNNGYFNFGRVAMRKTPFNFIIGGRGTGKTYGALEYVIQYYETTGRKFILMRRTQTQLDKIANEAFNPFKSINSEYHFKPIVKNVYGIYKGDEGTPAGYGVALSTISSLRGFDASDVDIIIYDEFIGEKHERPIKSEGDALLNAYETVNRNRELNGREPVKLFALANSNDLANAIFLTLELVTPAELMKRRGLEFYEDGARGFSLYLLNNSPISKAKKQTALYKMAAGSEFENMAIENEFAADEMAGIKSEDLKQYKLLCTCGEISIYKRKAGNAYYITPASASSAKAYASSDMDLRRFRREKYFLWLAYLNNIITFESYTQKVLFEKYFGA